jgi:hypothetical protein
MIGSTGKWEYVKPNNSTDEDPEPAGNGLLAWFKELHSGNNSSVLLSLFIISGYIYPIFFCVMDIIANDVAYPDDSFYYKVILLASASIYLLMPSIYVFVRRRTLTGIALANCWLATSPVLMVLWWYISLLILLQLSPVPSGMSNLDRTPLATFLVSVLFLPVLLFAVAVPGFAIYLRRERARWGEAAVWVLSLLIEAIFAYGLSAFNR